MLERLEKGERSTGNLQLLDDLPLFSFNEPIKEIVPSEIEERLKDTLPDDLSPKQALDFVYELKALLEK